MANVVDFSQLRQKVTPWGEVLDPITEELKLRAANQEKRDMQELRDAPERAREDRRVRMEEERQRHNRETEGLNERRQVGAATIQNGQSRGKTEDAARAAAAMGELDKAEQIGASYQEMDPATGAVSKGLPGFKIDRGIEPALPPADSAKPGETVDSVLADPDSATITDPANDAAVKEWQRKQSHPDIMIAGVKTTPEALRLSASKTRAGDMADTENLLLDHYAAAQRMGDPRAIESARRQLDEFRVRSSEVASGALKPSDAARAREAQARGEDKAGAQMDLQGEKDKTALAGKRIAAEAAGARAAATGARTGENLDFKQQKERHDLLRKDKDMLFTRFNAKTTQEAAQEFPNIIDKLNSGNGRLQTDALITMMRLAQKDNRFSDADAKLAMKSGVGWLDQVESGISKGYSGEYGDDVIRAAAEAAQRLHGYYQAKNAAMLDEADSFLDNPDVYDPKDAAQILGRELPGFRARHPELFGKKGGGGARPSRDPSNPDDPNAPDAGRPLEGDGPPPAGKLTREEAIKEARRRGLIK